MPYIKKEKRKKFDALIESISCEIDNKGELNYCITRLVHLWVLWLWQKWGYCYDNLSKGHNVLQDAAAEYYHAVMAPYEGIKRKENGSISELDKEKTDE